MSKIYQRSQPKFKLSLILIFVFVFAFLIRLIALNQSFWLDEATTARVVDEYGLTQIISRFSPSDFHPPLYYLLMKVWTSVFGYSEIALRMPSVLFSLLTGWIIYKIYRLRQGFGEPMWPAAFFLFNPLIIYYSQEARMYMLAVFLLSTSLFFFIKILQVKSEKLKVKSYNSKIKNYLIFFNLFNALSFYTFYGSVFLIAAMFIYLLYKKQYKIFFISLLFIIFSLLILFPLLYQQLIHSKTALLTVKNWSLVLGKANIKNLFLIPIKFSIGRISFHPKIIYWGISGVWGIWVFWNVLVGGLKNKGLLFLFIFPIILGFFFSFFTPLLQYFRFLYLLPIISLLLALGTRTTINRLIVVVGFFTLSLAYLFIPQFHREDWKGLAKSLPKDRPVYMIISSSDPIKYYSNNLKVNQLTRLHQDFGGQSEIVIIPYTTEIYGFDYKKVLLEKKFKLKERKNFRGLNYEIWQISNGKIF